MKESELKMKYFDTHAHYDDEAYESDRDEIIKACKLNGIEYIVNASANVETSKKAIELSNNYDYVYCTVGIHPQEVYEDKVEDILNLYNELNNGKIVAIGEIGLDYHYDGYDKKLQSKLFCEQIELADYLNLPIVIHSRDASLDTYNVIKKIKRPKGKVLFHCFQPSDDLVRLVLENNYTVAFGGNITYPRNETFKKYVDMIPLANMVLETDAPYLTPVPYRGKRNNSIYLKDICKRLAEYKKEDEAIIAETTFKNALDFFEI